MPPPRARRRGWTREFRNQVLVVAAFVVLLAAIVGIIGFAVLQDYWEENVSLPNSTALQVGDTTFDLDFFVERTKLLVRQSGLQGQIDSSQVLSVIGFVGSVLEEEELLLQRAGPDLGIGASMEEVEQEIADTLGVSLDDRAQFEQAFQVEVRNSGLSEQEYWEMTEATVLGEKVSAAFNNSVLATLEQVNLKLIQVATEDEANTVRQRLDEGEDFGELAQELSLDDATKESGGERGWVAREELPFSYVDAVFALEAGTVSEPIETDDGFFVFEVTEKDPDREVTDTQRSTIGNSYFSYWLEEQRTLLLTTDFVSTDPDKLNWAVERAFDL